MPSACISIGSSWECVCRLKISIWGEYGCFAWACECSKSDHVSDKCLTLEMHFIHFNTFYLFLYILSILIHFIHFNTFYLRSDSFPVVLRRTVFDSFKIKNLDATQRAHQLSPPPQPHQHACHSRKVATLWCWRHRVMYLVLHLRVLFLLLLQVPIYRSLQSYHVSE